MRKFIGALAATALFVPGASHAQDPILLGPTRIQDMRMYDNGELQFHLTTVTSECTYLVFNSTTPAGKNMYAAFLAARVASAQVAILYLPPPAGTVGSCFVTAIEYVP